MNRNRKRICLLLIAASLALSLFCLIFPVVIIWPFRHQGPRELAVALTVLRFRPLAVSISFAVALSAALAYFLFERRLLRRAGVLLAGAAVCLVTGLCAVNIYEMMFHPVPGPAFIPVAETKLDPNEMVIAIRVAGAARAYPIRSISYHHIVNDFVAGVPIAATY